MRTRKNTEPVYDRDYRCALDAVTTLFWAVPLGLVVIACGGNFIALGLVAVVVAFSVLIARSN